MKEYNQYPKDNDFENLLVFEELWHKLDVGKEPNEENVRAFIKELQRIKQYCREQLTLALSASDNIDYFNMFIANIVEFIPSFFQKIKERAQEVPYLMPSFYLAVFLFVLLLPSLILIPVTFILNHIQFFTILGAIIMCGMLWSEHMHQVKKEKLECVIDKVDRAYSHLSSRRSDQTEKITQDTHPSKIVESLTSKQGLFAGYFAEEEKSVDYSTCDTLAAVKVEKI